MSENGGETWPLLQAIVASVVDASPAEIDKSSHLSDELLMDSLDFLELAHLVSREFGVELPLTVMKRRFAAMGLSWLDENGTVSADGLAIVVEAIPEVQGRIEVGSLTPAVFTALRVGDLHSMLDRELAVIDRSGDG